MTSVVANIPDPRVIAERLRNARKARGITQEAVAEKLGMVRTTLVAIEKGDRRVSPGELVQLAALYGRPVSDFVRSRPESASLVPQFRAVAGSLASADELGYVAVAEELEGRALDYLELEQITGAVLLRRYPECYVLEDSHNRPEHLAEDIAGKERQRLGLGDAPIGELALLLEETVGLRIFFFEMPSRVAGVFGYTDALGGCIGINLAHPVQRTRLSLGHEYGHFLTSRYRADVAFLEHAGRSAAERFADSFAVHFLMPRSAVNRRCNEITEARRGPLILSDLMELADWLGVSAHAMCLRLEDLKRVPHGTWERLKQKKFQPNQVRAELRICQPNPNQPWSRRYLRLAKVAWDKELLSEGKLMRKLRMDRLATRELMEQLAQQTDEPTEDVFQLTGVDLATVVGAEA